MATPEQNSLAVAVSDPNRDDVSTGTPSTTSESNKVTTRKLLTVVIICLMNLINFTDRYATPGMLTCCRVVLCS